MEDNGVLAIHNMTILGRAVSLVEVAGNMNYWFGTSSMLIVGVCSGNDLIVLTNLIRDWLLQVHPDNVLQNGFVGVRYV